MNYIIDSEQLANLLQRRKQYIGKRHPDIFPHIVAGLSFCVGLYSANIPDIIWGIPECFIKILLYFLAIIYMVWRCVLYYRRSREKYNYSVLLKEIKALNKEQHQYSLVAIKDSFNPYPKRILQYYDTKWKTWFFPCFRTTGGTENDDLINICSKLSTYLEINKKDITVQYLTRRDNQSKFSEVDQELRVYDHRYYIATISDFPSSMQYNEFMIGGQLYKWSSFAELRNDDNVMAKNKDVIDVFAQYC